MRKKIILFVLLGLQTIYADNLLDVSKEVCIEIKKGDLDALKTHLTKYKLNSIIEDHDKIKEFMSSPKYLDFAKDLNCDKPDKIKTKDNGQKLVYYGRYAVRLKLVNSQWKLYDLF